MPGTAGPIGGNARVYNNDGSESAATPLGAENANVTVNCDVDILLRFQTLVIQVGSSFVPFVGSCTFQPQGQYSLNGAGWNTFYGGSSVVRTNTTTNFADQAATTQRLTDTSIFGNAFVAGKCDQDDGTTSDITLSYNDNTSLQQWTEHLFCVRVRSADVNHGDLIQVRPWDHDTNSAYSGGYNHIITLTVNKPQTLLKTRLKGGFPQRLNGGFSQ